MTGNFDTQRQTTICIPEESDRAERWIMAKIRENYRVADCYTLLDNLMDDRRFAEAEEYLRRFRQVDHSFRGPLYQGLLAWHRGEREEAHDIRQRMLRDFGGDWMAWFSMGDVYAGEERYAQALSMYEKAMEVSPTPRYVDSSISIAHVREILGDREGAIAAYQTAVDILARDWATRTGETVDSLNREILRLKRE